MNYLGLDINGIIEEINNARAQAGEDKARELSEGAGRIAAELRDSIWFKDDVLNNDPDAENWTAEQLAAAWLEVVAYNYDITGDILSPNDNNWFGH